MNTSTDLPTLTSADLWSGWDAEDVPDEPFNPDALDAESQARTVVVFRYIRDPRVEQSIRDLKIAVAVFTALSVVGWTLAYLAW